MDNSLNKRLYDKIENILLVVIPIAGLLFMVIYWR